MKENLVKLIQKISGIVLIIITFKILPMADGDATYALVTIPLGLYLIISNKVIFDDLLPYEEKDIEEEEEL